MSKTRTVGGYSRTELLIIVIALVALSWVLLPRFMQEARASKQNVCDMNVDMITSAIELYNADNGAYPNSLQDVTGDAKVFSEYFPEGPPVCPLGGQYIMDSERRVRCTHWESK